MKIRVAGEKAGADAGEVADMTDSERLASLCQPLWELRAGRRSRLPDSLAEPPDGRQHHP